MPQKKRYSSEQKAKILRELLEKNIPISQLCEQYGVRPNDIYNWRKKLFESAPMIFGQRKAQSSSKTAEQKKIEKLEATIRDRDEAINYLIQETINTKKKYNGEN